MMSLVIETLVASTDVLGLVVLFMGEFCRGACGGK
jgi:hypothetical protein